ncbi:Cytokinin dehydrogenase 7 [Dichanthelium oligosanthes]|uniref:cytokinin dehydrogenase n=1 Tax=Dichanthelium oligosanthes TaxID=888268 RepID=A0A1E5UVQ1_9POAL|nr:Cytokinin dehydrogenase 7 [Dichanthelium oligosanthes]
MARTGFAALVLLTSFLSVVAGQRLRPLPAAGLPGDLFGLGIASRLHTDLNSTARASTDFGQMVKAAPEAVFHPRTPADIAALIRFSASSPAPFPVAPRGQGHSWRGQSLAPGGVVVDMRSLGRGHRARINVSAAGAEPYVDAGGEQLWNDVLRATLKHGLAPRVWTDYLRLTVGGTLSNAGIGGQAFRHGPQIANVDELDVVTGTGEMVTCSRDMNSDLFLAALGGLGQFGVITRARIRLEPAPKRVHWVRLAYSDVAMFTKDQEFLISDQARQVGFNYVEGQVQLNRSFVEGPKSTPFFSTSDLNRLSRLASRAQSAAIYYIEGAMYYNEDTTASVDQKMEALLDQLSFEPGFVFTKDVTYVQFLDRVREEEKVLRSAGVWEVPHPWLNLFIPRSRILDFDTGVFKGLLRDANPAGIILMYPMNKDRWDNRMTAMTPTDDEEVFYAVSLLWSALSVDDVEQLEKANESVLDLCAQTGIECKQYLPHHTSQDGWQRYFGAKWGKVAELKAQYDPQAILSPGQKIFPSRAEAADIATV